MIVLSPICANGEPLMKVKDMNLQTHLPLRYPRLAALLLCRLLRRTSCPRPSSQGTQHCLAAPLAHEQLPTIRCLLHSGPHCLLLSSPRGEVLEKAFPGLFGPAALTALIICSQLDRLDVGCREGIPYLQLVVLGCNALWRLRGYRVRGLFKTFGVKPAVLPGEGPLEILPLLVII